MIDFQVSTTTVETIYQAVRIGGQTAWDDNRSLKKSGESRFLTQFPDDPAISWDTWKRDKRHFARTARESHGFRDLTALKQSLPDIIISDLRMPNMNGYEFLSLVRSRFSQIPVMAIGGEFSGRDVPERVLADAFFEKGQYSPRSCLQRFFS